MLQRPCFLDLCPAPIFLAVISCIPAAAASFGAIPENAAPKIVSSVEIPGGQSSESLETKAGDPLDRSKLSNDVKTLWRTGRFSDIRAETEEDGEMVRVVFRAQPNKTLRLRKVEMKPNIPGIEIQLKPGSEITAMDAHEVGEGIRKRLEGEGYPFVKVDAELKPVGSGRADLRVVIDQGRRVDVAGVSLTGDLGAPGEDPRKALHWTTGTRVLPPIPGLWNGWRLHSAYTEGRVQYDLTNLRSFYYSRGYFDASVKAEPADISAGNPNLHFLIQAGPRYSVHSIQFSGANGIRSIPAAAGGGFPEREICKALFEEHRDAERAGILDFTSQIEVRDLPELGGAGKSADLMVTSTRGTPYRIGRIEFRGNRSFSDATIRRAFLLDEGDLLDQGRLRKSLARLNNTGLFEPLSESNVAINTPPGSDRADIFLNLRERKTRFWNLSGPVGPMSIGGSLYFKIGTRLPPWGWRLVELSTYTVSMNFMLIPKSVATLLPGFPSSGFLAAATIQRPLLPGQPIFSGFSIAPQLGWQGMLLGYGFSRARWLVSPWFSSPPAPPALAVAIVHTTEGGATDATPTGTLYCEAPKPRFTWARRAGGLATGLMFSLAPF